MYAKPTCVLSKTETISHLCAKAAHTGAGVLIKKVGYTLLSTKLEVEIR